MAEPIYLKDYVNLWRESRPNEFQAAYQKATLVGVGMAGDLGEASSKKAGATMKASKGLLEQLVASRALVDRVWLLTKSGGGRGPGATAGITVGRAADNDVVINEYSMSKNHCEFRHEMGRVVVVDKGSTNGTWVGDAQVPAGKGLPVKDGDSLCLGRYRFTFLTAAGFVARVKALAEK